MGRKIRRGQRDPEKERYWRGMIGEAAQSGKPARQFCQEKGINPNQYYSWKRVLKRRDGERPGGGQAPGFVELVAGIRRVESSGVSIAIGRGLRIHLERGFDAETLEATLSVAGKGGVP